ncbi:MAG: hypothetical protein WC846_04865 [Candidatus Gracilibacteria bacterium]|jgi:hypothetical protein
MKKIALILALVLLSSCTKPVEIESSNQEFDEELYSIGSYLTFSVPTSGYTMTSVSTEGKMALIINDDNSDLEMKLILVTDLSDLSEAYDIGFNLEPLSVSQLLSDYTTGDYISKNCEAHFAEKGARCNMGRENIIEVVRLENQGDMSDQYLVIICPYGKGNGVAGLIHISNSINLDPTDLELASAKNAYL